MWKDEPLLTWGPDEVREGARSEPWRSGSEVIQSGARGPMEYVSARFGDGSIGQIAWDRDLSEKALSA